MVSVKHIGGGRGLRRDRGAEPPERNLFRAERGREGVGLSRTSATTSSPSGQRQSDAGGHCAGAGTSVITRSADRVEDELYDSNTPIRLEAYSLVLLHCLDC